MEEKETFEHEALRSHPVARNADEDDEVDRADQTPVRLQQIIATLRREREILEGRLSEIETSLSWLVVSRLRRLRAKVFRPGTLLGRCWSQATLFVKTARAAGLGVAMRKPREELLAKFHRSGRGRRTTGSSFPIQSFREDLPGRSFRELPWKLLKHDKRPCSGSVGDFKVLLVSHSACRTGAPLCLLRLAEELCRRPEIECFVVLKKGGELADSFARVAPTLELDWLAAQGIARHAVPKLIASAFREFSSRGVALCNTLAVSEFHPAFADLGVEVLSWIHELPTFISLLGGDESIELIERASRRIMVPSQAVQAAIGPRFGIEQDRFRTVYNGQDPRTEGLDRAALRRQVRRELGLSDDARIVLGCGTIHLRKGADLFVNVARRVLQDSANNRESSGPWFVWVGHVFDEHLDRWLLHDSRIGGLEDRIRFIGPRGDMAPYYMAADLFALTSREDPCPLVNMEAMESGMPVVAFEGAGGAPEVLGDAGICVPYIDATEMARAIRDLLSDDERRLAMGRRGRARIRNRFTWARFMDEFLEILEADYGYRPSQPADARKSA